MAKKSYKNFIGILVIISMITTMFTCSSSADSVKSKAVNDFSMNSMDKGYVTFIFDDGRMPFTKECFELFQEYDMPICCAIVANRAKSNLDLFLKIQESGGEILSHSYSHTALHSGNSTLDIIERELGDAYRVLSGLGFNINGIVETGNGGGEKTADYELIETVSRKYYKYSNAYGVSPQYNMDRTTLNAKPINTAKSYVYSAIKDNKWVALWMHDFSEFSKSDMIELLDYIVSRGKDRVEVVTWNYVYENFGNYTGPQVPTQEAIDSVCATQSHNIKDAVVNKPATCTEKGEKYGTCSFCGKEVTLEIDIDSNNHIGYSNATCTKPKTCKCGETSGKELGHTGGTATCKAKAKCSRCGEEYGELKSHNWQSATCTKAKTCKVCGTTSGSKLGHSYSIKYKKATESANGQSYKECSRCENQTSKAIIYKIKSTSLKTKTYTYNGKVKKPTVVVKDSKGKVLKQNTDYTVKYLTNGKTVGIHKVKITFKTKYSGSKILEFKINPSETKVTKLTAGKKSLKVVIAKKTTQTSGYQIQYSTSKSFKSYKTKTLSGYKKTSVTLKGLRAKKTYYVRVRTYKTVNGKKYYSAWSKHKYKKTK